MAGVDPFEGLLALGVITREQLKECEKVDDDIATTVMGRLVAVGVHAPDLLQAISKLTGLPLATREQLDAVSSMDGFSGAVERGLRSLPAAPMTRGADGTVDVVVADPRAADRVGQFIARHRVFLALELEVKDAIERAIPKFVDDDDVADAREPAPAPTVAPAPAPAVAPAPAAAQQPARAPSHAPSAGSAISIVAASPAPAPSVDANDVEIVVPQEEPAPMERMERAKPVREKFAPGVKRQDPMAQQQQQQQQPSTTSAQPAREPSGPAPVAQQRPKTESRPMPQAARNGGSRTPMIVGAVVVVVVLVVGGLAVSGVFSSAPPPAPVDEIAMKQQKGLDEARAFAAKTDHAWAITRCTDVVSAGSTTTLGKQAAVLCATERVALGEMDGIGDLQRFVDNLAPNDPVRPEAEAALQKLRAARQ